MKIVNPSATYLNPSDYSSSYQFIEKVGRTCYKSECSITVDSSTDFISHLVKNGHWAMLEHSYLFVELGIDLLNEINKIDYKYKRFLNICGNKMSASFRSLYEFICNFVGDEYDGLLKKMQSDLKVVYPEIFSSGGSWVDLDDSSDYRFLSRQNFIKLCKESGDYEALRICLPHTILFTVNRGVTHELVRHRTCSFAQESTRYCNYGAGKFGNEITVVAPFWLADDRYVNKKVLLYKEWLKAMNNAETSYMALLNQGAIAQEARAVLPISIKNDIVITATEEEWEHIINLRVYGSTGKPHPDMRLVMIKAAEELRKASDGRLYKEDYIGML